MTELVWEGKYLNEKRVAPVRIALPFQTVETVNESAQDRLRTLDLFAAGRETDWRNRLIWGDKKYVLPSLLPEFAGKVNLVYIDPPFDTGADFSYLATIPDHLETAEDDTVTFVKEPSILEQKAYRDTWGRGLDSYLQWLYEAFVLLRELLAEDGSLYVHIGPNMNHYVRACLDEVFGPGSFQCEIVWKRVSARSHARRLPFSHDYILFFGKSDSIKWNSQYVPHGESYIASHYSQTEQGTGRRYRLDNVLNQNPDRPNLTYEWKGLTRTWRWTKRKMAELDKAGRLVYAKSGMPSYKRYLDEMLGVLLQSLWTDIPPVNSQSKEDTGYPTQKPEALLERIIKASSDSGDLILDCFAGSGTTAVVAERLGRRWIACDLSRFSIHTARKRLLEMPGVRPFMVQNLGKYERQAWQAAEFAESSDFRERETRYRSFILELYHGTAISGHMWLHGAKSGRMVHVGAVDAPVTLADVKAIASEVWRAAGKGKDAPKTAGVDVLGWEFAFELNELARQVAAESRVDVTFKKIPREVLEKRAVEQGDIRFFELAALAVDMKMRKREVSLTLNDFVISPDDVPDEIRRSIKHWSQYVDYWAVDWDYREDTFHNVWQTYRTKKNPKLETTAVHMYDEPGRYVILVKVIDILGNDTTKAVPVEVK
ncbi:MAG: site-specific DNA-methyltransferase [Candidatus Rokubacteria bacterium]|nr:site-specific DNA-methyltransferase [Candidatus Rokubacteria bacterium]